VKKLKGAFTLWNSAAGVHLSELGACSIALRISIN
jgi:hypothetical protein